jgi:hypothetical protein
MPTVLTIFGLRVVIYPNDHQPAHVHVIGNGNEAVFNLHCPRGLPELRKNTGFSRKELERIGNELVTHLPVLCGEWRRIHENY